VLLPLTMGLLSPALVLIATPAEADWQSRENPKAAKAEITMRFLFIFRPLVLFEGPHSGAPQLLCIDVVAGLRLVTSPVDRQPLAFAFHTHEVKEW
jgi:hypothetical protein